VSVKKRTAYTPASPRAKATISSKAATSANGAGPSATGMVRMRSVPLAKAARLVASAG